MLNSKLQGRGTTIIDFIDALNAFVQKLENWTRKAEKGTFAMIEVLSTVSYDVDDALSSEILVLLTSLQKEFLRYFSEISESDLKLMRKPFAVPVEKVRDDQQDELIDYKNNSTCRDMFDTLSI